MIKNIKSPVTFQKLCDFVEPLRILGKTNTDIIGCAPINNSSPQYLSFCNYKEEKALTIIYDTKAGIILCNDDIPRIEKLSNEKCILTVKNPRLKFIQCLNNFFKPNVNWGIHPTAIIGSETNISPQSYIGAMTYVGDNVEIGDKSIIENNVHIASDSMIGRNVFIQTGAVIGCEGQGFERNEDGSFEKFIQIGCVTLEDDVEIGANSTIVRGTLSETRIGKGSKIGHLTDIGHNVNIGEHVFVSAGVVAGGSSIIGEFSWLAPKCCIRNKVKLGKRVTVGLGAVVTKDVPDNTTVVGVPARPIKKRR